MRRCAFLTLEDPTGYVIEDDDHAHAPLRGLGWEVDVVPWTRPSLPWEAYDAVVIRSTWDYPAAPDRFLGMLEEIQRSGPALFNSLELVRWNLHKAYLRDLAGRGLPVVPTVYRERLEQGGLAALLDEVGAAEAVIKPVVGANAAGAARIGRGSTAGHAAALEAYFADRALIAQPFVPAVITEGEFSLFYFDGAYSHAVLKTPKPADFRVQEEHGGEVRPVAPDESLRRTAQAVLHALGEVPLYARVDLVRATDGSGFWLMELELIEPSLYFRMDAQAPARFARALHARVRSGSPAHPR
jgi:glutathione synthase/RimK-type ligase-like ATP-grasp enzyme